MKKTLLSIAALALASFTFAQTVITDENFDSYTAGQTVSSQGSDFEAWTGAASEEAVVSTDFASSPANSMKIVNDNDMIYRFGPRTTGSYDIEFKMLVNSTDAGYFNIEHTFGGNYAYSFFFTDGGMIHKKNGNPTVDAIIGSYTKGIWMNVVFHINLNTDSCIMIIDNDTLLNEVFSAANDGTANIQLDVIDFYGLHSATDSVVNSLFYIDDFKFTEIIAPTPPAVTVDTVAIITNGTPNPTIAFSNNGGADMNYRAYAVYDDHATFSGPISSDILTHNTNSGTGYSYGSSSFIVGTQKKAIVRFYNNHLQNFIGLTIDSVVATSVTGYQGDSVRLFFLDRGAFINYTDLGGQSYTETFHGIGAHTQYSLPLSTPYQITGEEVIVGLKGGIGVADTSIFGMEFNGTAVPSVPHCNFSNLGSSYTEYSYNYSLLAYVSGAKWPTWLTVTPANGLLAQGGSQNLTLTTDTAGLTIGETYTAKVVFGCDDPTNEFNEISVTYTPIVGINGKDVVGILTYPNPTSNYFVINADINISNIQVYSVSGQLITNKNMDSKTAKINLSNFANGTYYAKIKVGNEIITRTIIKN